MEFLRLQRYLGGRSFLGGNISLTRSLHASRSAFSTIELLIVMVVVTILVAVTVPAIAGSRRASKSTRALNDVHQYSVATLSYSNDFSEYLPFAGVERRPELGVVVDGTSLDLPYFMQSYFAVHFVVPNYIPTELRTGSQNLGDGWISSARSQGYRANLVLMTATAFATPDYWKTDEAPADVSAFYGQRTSLCAFPSQKVVLYNSEYEIQRYGYSNLGKWMGATFDGAASIRGWEDPIPTSVARPLGALPALGMSTRNGLRGIDW
jgi:type II secretory pathway pseudopilin PulG